MKKAYLPAVLATLAASLSAQGPDPLVRENATVKLSAHVYAIPDNNVPLVPNVGIVVGNRATLIIDPGLGRRNGEAVMREVAKVSKNTELYIASTHFHAEHTTGYNGIPAEAKYVNSTIQEQEFAEGAAAQIKTFSGRSPATAELLKDATGRKADITFDRDYRLDLGGVRVRMIVVGPTHTRGDTGLFVEEDKILFSGDVVMNNSFLAATAASSMKAWLAAFDTFEKLAPITIVPSHGSIGTGALITANRAVMETIQGRARTLKASGQPVDAVVNTIQAELVAKYPSWARTNGIAAAVRSAYSEAP